MRIQGKEKKKEHNVIVNFETGLILRYKLTDKLIKMQLGVRKGSGGFWERMKFEGKEEATRIFTINHASPKNSLNEMKTILDAQTNSSVFSEALKDINSFDELEERHLIELTLALQMFYNNVMYKVQGGYYIYTNLEERTAYGRYIKVQRRF